MFKSIKINNLRGITELEIDNLGQVNLFVGENNCGKTTILEAIFFLVGATNPQLPLTSNNLRGLSFLSNELWSTFFHNMEAGKPIEIKGELQDSMETQNLLISPIKKEKLTTRPLTSNIVSLEAPIGEPKTPFEINGLELKYLSSQQGRASTSTIFQKGNEIVVEGTKEPTTRGFFLSGSLNYNWKDSFGAVQRKKQIDKVISFLKQIEPQIQNLSLNEIGLVEADIGLPSLVPVNLMGGGIAKTLSVVLAMFDVQKNGVLLVDEIENALHYSAQQNIWKAVFSLAQKINVQVFATTHSRECIAAFSKSIDPTLFKSEAKLFRIERKDEKFRAVEYTKELLAESIESNWEVR